MVLSDESFVDVRISVIIPARDATETIGEQLGALAAQDVREPFEVVVVDNRSTDDLAGAVAPFESDFASLRVVPAADGSGAAYARNVGVRAARGDVLIFCDADDLVGERFVQSLVDELQWADLAICRTEERDLNEHCWLSEFGITDPGGVHEGAGSDRIEDHRSDRAPHLVMVRGWGFATYRRVHDSIGGFDETFGAAEDLDYGFRAQLRGARVALAAGALLHYRLRTTTADAKRQWISYGRCTAQLTRRYEPHHTWGQRTGSWSHHLIGWAKLAKWRAKISSRQEMALWLQASWFRWGLFLGSLSYFTTPFE